jgi:hypothetical protein
MEIAALAKRPVTAQARNVFFHIGLLRNLRLCLLNSTSSLLTTIAMATPRPINRMQLKANPNANIPCALHPIK